MRTRTNRHCNSKICLLVPYTIKSVLMVITITVFIVIYFTLSIPAVLFLARRTVQTEYHEFLCCETETDQQKMAFYLPVTPEGQQKVILPTGYSKRMPPVSCILSLLFYILFNYWLLPVLLQSGQILPYQSEHSRQDGWHREYLRLLLRQHTDPELGCLLRQEPLS